MLTLTASILETVIIKTSVFATQQIFNIAYYGGLSIYNWYNPTLSETEILQQKLKLLQNEIDDLKQINYKHIIDSVIVLDDTDDENDNNESNNENT